MNKNRIILSKKYGSAWRWVLVGTTTAVIDFMLFLLFYNINNSALIANLIAGIFSIFFNYLAHYFWSFKSQIYHSCSGFKYLLNLLIFWSLSTLFLNYLISVGIDHRIAKISPMLFLAPFSFFSLKIFVFKKYTL
jgi:putative flippase GtrA